ncbi:MAG: hypothetical protein CVU79_02820 [Elusimicrobia bacterium HGW-Elusimicrobia-3]|jgi:hypothetical protein|nr:MAG: hypothetical protein CVU79_02820 [Elusimicrobia bacterium HGW-Elusimicrobia-3]
MTEETEVYVYHRKAPDFAGDRLFPLNRLKELYPAVYAEAVRKYTGREWLLDVVIPPLGCLWNDAVHFSLMHPSLIYESLLDAGIKCGGREIEWFEVPLAAAARQPSVLYINSSGALSETKAFLPGDFETVSGPRVKELSGMPEINISYYRDCAANGSQALLFKRAPHLLVNGEIDVRGCRVFDWKDQ